MSQATVQTILAQIEQLSPADRQLLEERLAELAEAEWKREAEAARQRARDKGIDQAAIDEAIDRLRYGK